MAKKNQTSIKSTAILGGHPIHPMLIPFPIAFLTGALVTDIVFASTANPFWASMSYWLIFAGIVMGGLAAIFGIVDFFTIKRARHATGWAHAIGNVTAVTLSLINLLIRVGGPPLRN